MNSRARGILCVIVTVLEFGCAAHERSQHMAIAGHSGTTALTPVLAGPLTGSVPSTPSRSGPNGNGSTGSIACQFLGSNRPATKWWLGTSANTPRPGVNWEYNVQPSPADSVTGFTAGSKPWVNFYTAAPNVKPPSKQITVPLNNTIVLNVEYK